MASSIPRILFCSENLQLGGLCLLELARMHSRKQIELVALWSNQTLRSYPLLSGSERKRLLQAETIKLSMEPADEGVSFQGVYIPDYSSLAQELEMPYHQVLHFNTPFVALAMKELKLDVAISCGHAQIFNQACLKAPRMGWINFHPSLLPHYRGPFPAFWELRAGVSQSGVSMHLLTEKIDAGPLLAQEAFELYQGISFQAIVEKQAEICADLSHKHLEAYIKGELEAQPQPPGGSYQSKPRPKDFMIDAQMKCSAIACFVKGFAASVPLFLKANAQTYRIQGILGFQEGEKQPPGTLNKLRDQRYSYGCIDGCVHLLLSPFAGQS